MNNKDDLIYLAPMEGITGYIYRNAHRKFYGGVDKYFMPFIAPAKGRPLRNRELRLMFTSSYPSFFKNFAAFTNPSPLLVRSCGTTYIL